MTKRHGMTSSKKKAGKEKEDAGKYLLAGRQHEIGGRSEIVGNTRNLGAIDSRGKERS